MNQREFESVVKKDGHQVFLMTCPATLPFSFAPHPWFVINKNGKLFRSGISWRQKNEHKLELFKGHSCDECFGHLHKDARPPLEGCGIFPFSTTITWSGRMVAHLEGDEAERMIVVIERAYQDYPYRARYSLFGPNSNTYIQWVLNHFPETSLKLPWNAIGRTC